MVNYKARPSFLRFLFVYMQRWYLTNVPYLLKNMLTSFVIIVLTCFAVKKNAFDLMEPTKSCLFSVLMCAIWSGLFNSIAMFFSESDYTMDDLTKVLPVQVYVCANVLIQAFLCLFEAMICVSVFYFFFHYSSAGVVTSLMNLDYTITFFLVMFSADMLGFAVGILVTKITTAMTILPIVLIAQFLFSGCLFELTGPLKLVSRFTTARWGFSALGSLSKLNDIPSQLTEMIPTYHAPVNILFDASASFVQDCWLQMGVLSAAAIGLATLLLIWKLHRA